VRYAGDLDDKTCKWTWTAARTCRNMINTGLGRFGLKQKVPMPHDHERVILFYVGGIGIADVRAMNQALALSQVDSAGTILCGGTTLLSPMDTLDRFLGS